MMNRNAAALYPMSRKMLGQLTKAARTLSVEDPFVLFAFADCIADWRVSEWSKRAVERRPLASRAEIMRYVRERSANFREKAGIPSRTGSRIRVRSQLNASIVARCEASIAAAMKDPAALASLPAPSRANRRRKPRAANGAKRPAKR